MKNNFDDIVRKKWEEKQFPVDDAHRQDMIRLLDQQPRRRTAIFWWFGAAGIIISVATAILLVNTKVIPGQPVAPTEHIRKAEPIATPQSSNAVAGIPGTQQEENQISSATEDSDNSATGTEKKNAVKNSNPTLTHHTKAITNNLKDNQPTHTPSSPLSGSPGKSLVSSNTNIENSAAPSTSPVTNQQGVAAVSSSEIKNDELISEQRPDLETDLKSNEAVNEVDAIAAVRNSSPVSPVDDLLFISIPVDKRSDNQNAAPVIAKRQPIALYAEVAAGYVPAPTRLISAGTSVRAGAGLSYGITSKWQVSATGGYMLQKDGFEFQKTSTSSFPGFGARSNFHTLTPDKLHFVYARLGIHHRIHRHIFSVYGGSQYLYGAQGNIVIQTNDQLAGESETSSYAWLKLDGMKRWLWNAEATYGYQLTPRLSAHAGVRYYFSEISSEKPEDGYIWEGKLTAASPFLTLNYHLYGTR